MMLIQLVAKVLEYRLQRGRWFCDDSLCLAAVCHDVRFCFVADDLAVSGSFDSSHRGGEELEELREWLTSECRQSHCFSPELQSFTAGSCGELDRL